MRWLTDRMRRVLCGLHGHDIVLRFEHDRLSLRCLFCSYETPGWSLRPDPDNTLSRGPRLPSRMTPPLTQGLGVARFAPGVRFAKSPTRADRFGEPSAAS